MLRISRSFLVSWLSQENKGNMIERQNDLFGKPNYFALDRLIILLSEHG
jgi:hypothetical protein